MSARALPKTRGQAITAKCRDCIYDPANGGTWREQVALCTATSCPLWRYRPMSAHAPKFLVDRNPEKLPLGWLTLQQPQALDVLRGKTSRGTPTDASKVAFRSENSPNPYIGSGSPLEGVT